MHCLTLYMFGKDTKSLTYLLGGVLCGFTSPRVTKQNRKSPQINLFLLGSLIGSLLTMQMVSVKCSAVMCQRIVTLV